MKRSFIAVVLLGLVVFISMTIIGCSGGTAGGTCSLAVPSPSPTDTTTPPGPTQSPTPSPSVSPSPDEPDVFVHNAYSVHYTIESQPEPTQSPQQRENGGEMVFFVESSFASRDNISTVTPKRVTPPEPDPTESPALTVPTSMADATPNIPTGILVDEYYSGATPGTPVPSMTVPMIVAVTNPNPSPSVTSYRPNVPYAVYWNNDVVEGIWKFEFGEDIKNVDNETNPKTFVSPPYPTVTSTPINDAYPLAIINVNQDVPLNIIKEANTGVLVQVYSNPVTNGAEQGAQPHFESLWTNVDLTSLDWSDPDSVDAFLNSLPDSTSFVIPAGVMKPSPIEEYTILVVVSTYKKGHDINRDPPFPSINYSVSRLLFPMAGYEDE